MSKRRLDNLSINVFASLFAVWQIGLASKRVVSVSKRQLWSAHCLYRTNRLSGRQYNECWLSPNRIDILDNFVGVIASGHIRTSCGVTIQVLLSCMLNKPAQ